MDLSDNYSTVMSLITMAGLEDVLIRNVWTFFAPTNTAIGGLPAETVTFLTSAAGMETLIEILSYHLVPTILTSDKLGNSAVAMTAQGRTVTIGVTNGAITVNDIAVSDADNLAINGVTHGIDTVLVPDPGTSAPTIAPTTSAGAALCTSFLGLLATILAMAF